jgi:hypothetical protein
MGFNEDQIWHELVNYQLPFFGTTYFFTQLGKARNPLIFLIRYEIFVDA